jgi:hypothetical protein
MGKALRGAKKKEEKRREAEWETRIQRVRKIY